MKKLIILLLVLGACGSYEPTTTDRAAVAGAVVGGVTGGVIGSSAGSTVAGVGLGGVAGAGVGALIGSELQDRDQQIAEQNRELLDARREISRQQREIEELRQATSDNMDTRPFIEKDSLDAKDSLNAYLDDFSENEINSDNEIQVESIGEDRLAEMPAGNREPIISSRTSSSSVVNQLSSRECQEAQTESGLAAETEVIAEKLYHLRRALRLCPDSSDLHTDLAEVYIKMGRSEHAKNELKEALSLNKNNSRASQILKGL